MRVRKMNKIKVDLSDFDKETIQKKASKIFCKKCGGYKVEGHSLPCICHSFEEVLEDE